MARSPRHVLVVEDDIGLRGRLRGWLEYEGYRVTGAENGQEARRVLKGENGPALALIDLQSEEGFQMVQEIAGMGERDRPTVIVMTDPEKRSHAESALKLGAAEYLEKPVSDAALQRSVAGALKGPQPKRAAAKVEKKGLLGRLLSR